MPEPPASAWDDIYAAYQAAIDWLQTFIVDTAGSRYLTPPSREEIRRGLEAQVPRLRSFLDYAGNPQTQYRVIHIAGTGGKGSVSTMIEAILRRVVPKVGLTVSPYVQVPNEKLVINGRMIRPSEFVALVDSFRRLYESYRATTGDTDLKYVEVWTALTHWYFARERIDWCVFEASMGGRFDPTNVVVPEVAVITNIDFDHVLQLGPGLADIAWHKAGIIKPGRPVVTGETKPEALAVIRAEADALHAPLFQLGEDYGVAEVRPQGAGITADVWALDRRIKDLTINSSGSYQALNAATAIATATLACERHGIPLADDAIRDALAHLMLPGRMETLQDRPPVIIDGAHNPQKMQALASAIRLHYPDRRIILVVGMLATKNAREAVRAIAGVADAVVATAPHIIGKPAVPPSELAALVKAARPGIEVAAVEDIRAAVRAALRQAGESDVVVITGSIYMLGDVRALWHPTEALLRSLEYS